MKLCILLLLINVNLSYANIGSGWSVKDDEIEAAKEAVKMSTKTVPEPNFVVMYTTSGYDYKKISAAIRKESKAKKFFGITSYRAVFTESGVHVGKKGSVAVLAYDNSYGSVGVGAASIEKNVDGLQIEVSDKVVEKATMQAITLALKNANKKESDKPSLVIVGGQPGIEAPILKVINKRYGGDVRIIGGSSNKDDFSPGPVFSNEKAIEKGVSLALFFTDKKIGNSFLSGFKASRKKGVVTKLISPTRIATIDNKPAFDVLNNWAGGVFKIGDIPKEGTLILKTAATNTFAKKTKGEVVTVVPLKLFPDKSIQVASRIEPNEEIYFAKGSTKILLKRTGTVAKKAIINGKIKKADVAGGLHIYCTGASWAVGEKKIPQAIPYINKAIGNKPYIGAFSGGEQGNFKGGQGFHGNLMSSMVVFEQ